MEIILTKIKALTYMAWCEEDQAVADDILSAALGPSGDEDLD